MKFWSQLRVIRASQPVLDWARCDSDQLESTRLPLKHDHVEYNHRSITSACKCISCMFGALPNPGKSV